MKRVFRVSNICLMLNVLMCLVLFVPTFRMFSVDAWKMKYDEVYLSVFSEFFTGAKIVSGASGSILTNIAIGNIICLLITIALSVSIFLIDIKLLKGAFFKILRFVFTAILLVFSVLCVNDVNNIFRTYPFTLITVIGSGLMWVYLIARKFEKKIDKKNQLIEESKNEFV